MKRFLLPLLAAALILAACACGRPAPAQTAPPTLPPAAATPTPVPERLYTLRLDAPYHTEPSFPPEEEQSRLPKDTQGFWRGESGDFIKLELYDGSQVWVHGWYLQARDAAEQQRWEAARQEALCSAPGFVPVEEFLPGAEDASFVCTAGSGLNCRVLPGRDSFVLTSIPFGTKVEVLGRENDFYLCRLEDGGLVYCSAAYLSSEDSYVVLPGAVDLRVYLPTLDFEMLFASPNNITGEAMYPAIPLLEESTARMLARAQEIFRDNGYSIKIYDAYRPKSAQYKLYDIVQDSRFIANPYNGNSWHNVGRAVDMSLIDLSTGRELEMPTPMHTFSTDASRFNSGQWSEAAQANVKYMTDVMTYVGFGTITTEWWHFENTAPGNYMDTELDFSALEYRPMSELRQPAETGAGS